MTKRIMPPRRFEDEDNSALKRVIDASIDLRSKNSEFHGLQRELLYLRTEMLENFDKSQDIKHPRDRGRAREIIMETFLVGTGLLPKKYGVSSISARVASPSGHCSKELDIVIYNNSENIHLMRRNSAIEYYPRETVFGSIQVKSRLKKADIGSAFVNISSYKMLYETMAPFHGMYSGRLPSFRGFGVIFAYDSDLDWDQIIKELHVQAKLYEKTRWPNVIFILKKGLILFGHPQKPCLYNDEIESISELQMHGYPDRDGSSLFQLYSLIMNLLHNTKSSQLNIDQYYNLPFTSGDLSYSFALGPFAEIATCVIHGQYLKKISQVKLAQIIAYCRTQTPKNCIAIIDEIYKRPENKESQVRQPGEAYVYNPDNIPLTEIMLFSDGMGLTYDMINTLNIQIWIPWYYVERDSIYGVCPACQKIAKTKERRKSRRKT